MSIYNQSQTSPYLGAQAKTVPAVAPKNTLKPADTKKGFIGGTLNPDGTMGTGKVSGVEPFNIISKKTTPVQPATGANVLGNTDIPGMTGTASMKPVPKEKTSIITTSVRIDHGIFERCLSAAVMRDLCSFLKTIEGLQAKRPYRP